jgi:hypothetical protein
MRFDRFRRPVLAALLLVAGCAHQPLITTPELESVPERVLVGCWRSEEEGTRTVEVWTPFHGDVMYGQNLALEDDADGGGERLVFFELLRVERRGDGLVYVARPGGGGAVEFLLAAHDERSLTFAAPDHDFPKRIRYVRDGADALRAIVDDGTDDGQRLTFAWRAVR